MGDGSGVRYALTGSVRRAGDRLRITAQLAEGAAGPQLWSQSFDGTVADIFDFQDRITESVASAIEPNIRAAETDRARRERPQSVAAYDINLQALAKILAESETGNAEAHRLLTRALELEPDNAVLLANAAWTLEHRIAMGWPAIGADDRKECLELSRRGLEYAAGNPQVMVHCGMAPIEACREYDWGMAVVRAAVDANPNTLMIVTAAGVASMHCGSIDNALAFFTVPTVSARLMLLPISGCAARRIAKSSSDNTRMQSAGHPARWRSTRILTRLTGCWPQPAPILAAWAMRGILSPNCSGWLPIFPSPASAPDSRPGFQTGWRLCLKGCA
jgi:hypothetical protein